MIRIRCTCSLCDLFYIELLYPTTLNICGFLWSPYSSPHLHRPCQIVQYLHPTCHSRSKFSYASQSLIILHHFLQHALRTFPCFYLQPRLQLICNLDATSYLCHRRLILTCATFTHLSISHCHAALPTLTPSPVPDTQKACLIYLTDCLLHQSSDFICNYRPFIYYSLHLFTPVLLIQSPRHSCDERH